MHHSTLESSKKNLTNLQNTIAALPLTLDQYQDQEVELTAFLASRGLDWTQRGLPAQPVVGAFDNTAPIEKTVRASQKFVTAEEEAMQRRAEVQAITSRKANNGASAAATAALATSVPMQGKKKKLENKCLPF